MFTPIEMERILVPVNSVIGKRGVVHGLVLAENMKPKQVRGALAAYAGDCPMENVVAMRDNTILANGKKGYLVSTEALYCNSFCIKDGADLPTKLPFRGMAAVELTASHADKWNDGEPCGLKVTYADGRVIEVFASIYARDMCVLLEHIIRALRFTD